MGAEPVKPPIPGIDGANVKSAAQVYDDPESVGKNVVILGGGLVGLELAIHLGDLGRNVTVVEMLDHLNDGGNLILLQAIDTQLKRLGTKICLNTKAVEVGAKGLVAEGPEGKVTFDADTVVYAAGQRPLLEVVKALSDCAPTFSYLGDCRAPRVIADATREAYYMARDIGR